MKENPEYELKLVDRTLKTNDDQIINEIQENLLITYKYYEIAFNNEKNKFSKYNRRSRGIN